MTRRLIRHRLASGDEVWLNAMTGAADRLSRKEVRRVEDALAKEEGCPEPLLKALAARGYLYPDKAAEKAAFEHLVKKQTALTTGAEAVKNLVVCPTYSCNLRCVYCFEHCARPELPHGSMNLQTVSRVMDAFAQIRAQEPGRRYTIGLFGGEPLMLANRAVVSRILTQAKSNALPVTIVTNGVNVSSYLPLLEEHQSVIQIVQLTLDGPEDVHDRRRPTASGRGTYRAVAAAADTLLKKGIRVGLRVNIDRENVHKLPELTKIASERGWAENPRFAFSLAPVKDHVGTGDIPNATPEGELLSALLDVYDENPDTEKLFGLKGLQVLGPIASLAEPGRPSRPKVYNCEANYGGFCVAGPDGYLYACPEAIGRPEMAIGRFMPVFELWQHEIAKWVNRNIESVEECRECSIGPLCGGGCTYASLVRYGDTSRPVCEAGQRAAMEVFIERRVAC